MPNGIIYQKAIKKKKTVFIFKMENIIQTETYLLNSRPLGAWAFCRNLFIHYSLASHFLESGIFPDSSEPPTDLHSPEWSVFAKNLSSGFVFTFSLLEECGFCCFQVFMVTIIHLYFTKRTPKPLRYMYIVILPRNHIKKKLINFPSLCSHPIPVTKINKVIVYACPPITVLMQMHSSVYA